MSKMLLIDGSGLLVANYYGTLPREAYDESGYQYIPQINGLYTNAVFPTIKQICDIALSSKCDYLGVAFDRSRNTFRKTLNSDYKANRKETPAPLKQQFSTCTKILESFGIFVISSEDYEADDLIGSISKQYSFFCDETFLLTKDKDYIQLVDDFTTVWMMLYKKEIADEKLKAFGLTEENGYNKYLPPKVFPYTPETVLKDKGIKPENFDQVLALMGDKADNIKGVKGISEETALKLISEYRTIDELYEEIEHANYTKTAKQLKAYWKENLKISRSPFNALIDYEQDARDSLLLSKIKTDIHIENFYIEKLTISETLKELDKVYKTNGFEYFRDTIYAKVRNLFKKMEE